MRESCTIGMTVLVATGRAGESTLEIGPVAQGTGLKTVEPDLVAVKGITRHVPAGRMRNDPAARVAVLAVACHFRRSAVKVLPVTLRTTGEARYTDFIAVKIIAGRIGPPLGMSRNIILELRASRPKKQGKGPEAAGGNESGLAH